MPILDQYASNFFRGIWMKTRADYNYQEIFHIGFWKRFDHHLLDRAVVHKINEMLKVGEDKDQYIKKHTTASTSGILKRIYDTFCVASTLGVVARRQKHGLTFRTTRKHPSFATLWQRIPSNADKHMGRNFVIKSTTMAIFIKETGFHVDDQHSCYINNITGCHGNNIWPILITWIQFSPSTENWLYP